MFRFFENQKRLLIILALFSLIFFMGAAVYVFPTANNSGFAPEQPVPFSHKVMAGDNKIPCLYCHSGAEKGRHATIPSMNMCMNCHSMVRPDSVLIQKVRSAWNEGRNLEWVRVHELPDFVYFSHKRHVAKGVQCETCHGDVKKMERLEQFAPLTMGWCLDCHRGRTTPKEVKDRIYAENPELQKSGGPIAPISCNTCHQ